MIVPAFPSFPDTRPSAIPLRLPVAIDYPAELELRQLTALHDELPKYLLAPEA